MISISVCGQSSLRNKYPKNACMRKACRNYFCTNFNANSLDRENCFNTKKIELLGGDAGLLVETSRICYFEVDLY
jgi:hypothetical protein